MNQVAFRRRGRPVSTGLVIAVLAAMAVTASVLPAVRTLSDCTGCG